VRERRRGLLQHEGLCVLRTGALVEGFGGRGLRSSMEYTYGDGLEFAYIARRLSLTHIHLALCF
jgi:hypothetical protein